MKITLSFLLFLSSSICQAIVPYSQEYLIYRDGKQTGKQITTLKQIDANTYALTDQIKGTHGLASVAGFKRNEESIFYISSQGIHTKSHNMKQKVAFSSRKFNFISDGQNKTVKGRYKKKEFQLDNNQAILSSHLIPIALGLDVCAGKTSMNYQILKSSQVKTYHFKIMEVNSEYYVVDRIYPSDSDKSTTIWLSKNENCLPLKNTHAEKDEARIETRINRP